MREALPEELRWEIFERDNFTCKRCGSRRRLAIDHIVPVMRGGMNDPANLQTLCKSCNSAKGARMEQPAWDILLGMISPEGRTALLELEADVASIKDDPTMPSFCANMTWFRDLKAFNKRIANIVGWYSSPFEVEQVRTQWAYNTAFSHLYELLPDCRNCWCA